MELNNYLKKHLRIVQILSKEGVISTSVLADLAIYECYVEHLHIESKMDRYALTAEIQNVSEVKVRKVVKKMESKMHFL